MKHAARIVGSLQRSAGAQHPQRPGLRLQHLDIRSVGEWSGAPHHGAPRRRHGVHAAAGNGGVVIATLHSVRFRQRPRQRSVVSRREFREAARALARRRRMTTISACAVLAASVGGTMSLVIAGNSGMPVADEGGAAAATVSGTSEFPATVSRSDSRVQMRDAGANGTWDVGESNHVFDGSRIARSAVKNGRVARALDADANVAPANFNPNHPTGDTGLAYPFSQCTWWAYTRRHQLGLPVGSYFGNGAQWADSAQRLGYWVDDTPRNNGDIMVFRRGQEGASSAYGHVAIVERINQDGSVTTSESGKTYHGKTFSRRFANVHDFRYIHF